MSHQVRAHELAESGYDVQSIWEQLVAEGQDPDAAMAAAAAVGVDYEPDLHAGRSDDLVLGLGAIVLGVGASGFTWLVADGGSFMLFWGLILYGGFRVLRGLA